MRVGELGPRGAINMGGMGTINLVKPVTIMHYCFCVL